MFKKILIICSVFVLCSCATKGDEKDQTENSISSSPEIRESIFNTPELDFVKEHGDILSFSDPQKVLSAIEEKLNSTKESAQGEAALLTLKSLAQSQLNNKDEAFETMTMALHKKPIAEIYALRGFVLWQSGKLRGALRDAEYALLKQNPLALATMVQGLVYLEEEDLDKACTMLKEACNGQECYGLSFAQEQNQCK